jgi:hypothetical protein
MMDVCDSDGSAAARWERVLAIAAVVWLQIVGVITDSIIHHILHAVPIILLAALPRSQWVRHTAALAGFIWLFMLALVSPMVHHALTRGIAWTTGAGAYTWLAPGMALLCAIWSSLNIAILGRRPRAWATAAAGLILVTILFAGLQPWCAPAFEVPLQRVLDGRYSWLAVLLMEIPLVLAIPWVLLTWRTAPPRPRFTRKAAMAHAAYWLLFLLCMVAGLHPVFN